MALEHALRPSTRNLFLRSPTSSWQSPKTRVFLQFPSQRRRQRSVLPLRYSVNYDEPSLTHQQAMYPRPAEIQWKKELSNSVNLIGVVGTSVEIKHLSSGKVVAFTRLAVRKSATDTTWVNLTFWEELAHIAFHHVEKGQQIYVSGRLVSDTVESEDGKQQTYYKVVVQQLNFVERSSSSSGAFNGRNSSIMPERKYDNSAASNMGSTSTGELWQAFFANPLEWWDNRKNKKSPKYPDFKHKDTGEALWIEGRNNPTWVKSQLEILDARMSSLRDKDNAMPVSPMFVDDFMHF